MGTVAAIGQLALGAYGAYSASQAKKDAKKQGQQQLKQQQEALAGSEEARQSALDKLLDPEVQKALAEAGLQFNLENAPAIFGLGQQFGNQITTAGLRSAKRSGIDVKQLNTALNDIFQSQASGKFLGTPFGQEFLRNLTISNAERFSPAGRQVFENLTAGATGAPEQALFRLLGQGAMQVQQQGLTGLSNQARAGEAIQGRIASNVAAFLGSQFISPSQTLGIGAGALGQQAGFANQDIGRQIAQAAIIQEALAQQQAQFGAQQQASFSQIGQGLGQLAAIYGSNQNQQGPNNLYVPSQGPAYQYVGGQYSQVPQAQPVNVGQTLN